MRLQRIKKVVLPATVFLLASAFSWPQARDSLIKTGKEIVIPGDNSQYRAFTDIEFGADVIAVVENFGGFRVLVWDRESEKFLFETEQNPKKMQEKLVAPIKLALGEGEIFVKDNGGLAVFGYDGRFRRRLRLFVNIISHLYDRGNLYILNGSPGVPDLIQVFSPQGNYLKAIGQEFVSPDFVKFPNWSPIGVKGMLYDGVLLTDGEFFYYLNAVLARMICYRRDGRKVYDRDIGSVFGEDAKKSLEENRRIWLEEGFDIKETKGRVPIRRVFSDAVLSEGKVYMLFMEIKQKEDKNWERISRLRILDKDSLDLESDFTFENLEEPIQALEVIKKEGTIFLYFPIYREQGSVIAEYRREK
jgi:hypothetical protein